MLDRMCRALCKAEGVFFRRSVAVVCRHTRLHRAGMDGLRGYIVS
jgi:hypothetical protein